MTAWIRIVRDDEEGQERVELAFNSLMMSVYQGSEPDQIVSRMLDNMKFQMENPVLQMVGNSSGKCRDEESSTSIKP